MRINKLFFIASALLILVATTTSSCRKKADTLVKITVIDSETNQAISGASVTLEATSSESILKEPSELFPMVSTSNSSGEAVFNFNEVYQLGQAGVAVLDIVVSSGSGNGTGVVKVEQEVTTKETVFI